MVELIELCCLWDGGGRSSYIIASAPEGDSASPSAVMLSFLRVCMLGNLLIPNKSDGCDSVPDMPSLMDSGARVTASRLTCNFRRVIILNKMFVLEKPTLTAKPHL